MSRPRLLTVIAAGVAALGLGACSSTCHNACSHQAWCDEHLGSSSITNVNKCAEECEADTDCVNKDEVYNCIAGVQCENNWNYGLNLLGCVSLCKSK